MVSTMGIQINPNGMYFNYPHLRYTNGEKKFHSKKRYAMDSISCWDSVYKFWSNFKRQYFFKRFFLDLGLLVRNMRLFLNFSNILQNPIFNTFYNCKEYIIYFITPNAKTCNFFNFFEKGILLKFVFENQLYFCL